jgi:hypothetical protein
VIIIIVGFDGILLDISVLLDEFSVVLEMVVGDIMFDVFVDLIGVN